MSVIVDMGCWFDGKCCVCREWIECYGDPTWSRANPVGDCKHRVAHARCTVAGRVYLYGLVGL